MKPLTFLFVLASCVLATTHGYNITTFMDEIDRNCLSRLWNPQTKTGDIRLLGLTMETFISIVEKVERNHNDWDIYTLSRILLKRFAFDGISFKKILDDRIASQMPEYKIRWDIMKQLVGGDADSYINFVEDDLNDVEKCTMFFMMSHLVNTTYREGRDVEDMEFPDVKRFDAQGNPVQRVYGVRNAKRPREQGVVSVKRRTDQAVAVNKILNAILASQHNGDHSIIDLFGLPPLDGLVDMHINALQGVTLADVLANAAIHQKEEAGLRYFGPLGSWNSSICPDEFILNEKPLGATNSVLRGAIDGLLIASALTNLRSRVDEHEIRLSRLLRMYYSSAGIPGVNVGLTRGYSYCRRNEVLNLGGGTSVIQESATAFFLVHTLREHGQIVGNPTDKINRAFNEFTTSLNELNAAGDECRHIVDEENPVCETPSNVFVVLSSQELKTEGIAVQQEVIGYLSQHLDVGVGASSLSVFLDEMKGPELNPVAYNATNPSCASCGALRVNTNHIPQGIVSLLGLLDKTLSRFSQGTDLLPAVPNKVVILFYYGQINPNTEDELKLASYQLRRKHQGTLFIAVGRNDEVLKKIFLNDGYINEGAVSQENLGNIILEKICQTPAGLQIQKKDNAVGYVTEGSIQYWSLHPKYFHNSSGIAITFLARNGRIKICLEKGCKISRGFDQNATFQIANTCGATLLEDCPFISLSVTGVPSSNVLAYQPICPWDHANCRRIGQIQYIVSYEGHNRTNDEKGTAVSDIVGPVSKATKYCSKMMSRAPHTPLMGEVAESGCQVFCTAFGAHPILINAPSGLTCNDGKGTCKDGACTAN